METITGKVPSHSGLSRKSGHHLPTPFPTLSRNDQSGCLLQNHLSTFLRGKNGFSIQGIASGSEKGRKGGKEKGNLLL